MRRIAPLCLVLLLTLPAAASAAITPTRDAGALAGAIADSGVVGAAFTEIPPLGNPAAVADTQLGGFPVQGATYAMLSSGDTTLAENPDQGAFANVGNGGPASHGTALDVTILRLDVDVPAAANCVTLSFRFLSEEFPEFVGAGFNDGFIAELDASTWSGSGTGLSAPNNFAFDEQGNVISVNTSTMSAGEAAGTIYGGATPRLSAAQATTAGAHSLYLSIFDQGDDGYDSTVFVDRLTFLTTQPGGCVPGATQDTEAPAVSISSPADGSSTTDTTPMLSGGVGTAPGDSSTVTVRVRAGGALVQTLTATASGGTWSVDAAPLGPGQYTAQAEQSDAAGNTGVSGTTTFTIVPPQPPPPPEPEPDLARSVLAGTVSGVVRVRTRGGRFRVLGPEEEIPLGATIDATRGKVRLTSAANAAGQTQTADFSRGMFVVTQDRTGLTQLALTGGSFRSCNARASASQRRGKRIRRLFGDGTGKFRTTGRHGAATVRGTRWSTEDRCDGSYFTAHSGSLTVRDFTRRRTVTVKRGQTYRAPAKRRR